MKGLPSFLLSRYPPLVIPGFLCPLIVSGFCLRFASAFGFLSLSSSALSRLQLRSQIVDLVGGRGFSRRFKEESSSNMKSSSSDQACGSNPQPSAPSVGEYVDYSSQNFRKLLDSADTGTTSKVTIVMGNEASDIDSIASSIILAYACSLGLLDDVYPEMKGEVVVPIINIPREDYALRQVRPAVLFDGDRNLSKMFIRGLCFEM